MKNSDRAAKPDQSVLEIGGRLKSPPADSMVNSAFASELDRQDCLFSAMGLADMAYTVTGINTGTIPAREGGELLSKLLALYSGPDSYSPRAEAGDLYTNREAWLEAETPTSGWLGAGRARREATTTAFLVLQRQQLLELLASLTGFGLALNQRAGEYSQVCMPDYTYLQAAQPTTFGHYLAGFLYPLIRDCERIEQLYCRVNSSPMGCGSTTGSRLAVDRQQMARLLGFDAVTIHTRDAMWQPDLPIETAAVLCAVAVNLSRLAEDLQIFSSREFALVELADQHARSSKIMPQKKNPFALTHIRSMSNEMMGLMTSVTAMARTPSGQPDNRLWIYGALPDAVSGMVSGVHLFTDVIRSVEFKRARGMQLLGDASLMATDLAETLVLDGNMDYRSAYRLATKLVDEYEDKGGIGKLNSSVLKQTAAAFLGREVSIEEEAIRRALDPRQSIETHTEPGTPTKSSMSKMLADCRHRLSRYGNIAGDGMEQLRRVERQLLDRVRELGAG
ncbi:MAG: lyase family protein [Gammaproteobacteria bacterium]|nr:lyase family protein [Gammaproteobacteria bacterium]MDE0513708.1 lyase family protein [Gammaproteobacteria bacterium]